jgi:hypothetical protein
VTSGDKWLGVYDNLNVGPIGVFLFFQGLLSFYKKFNLKKINGTMEVLLYVVGMCSRLLQLRNDHEKFTKVNKGIRVCTKYNVKGMEIILFYWAFDEFTIDLEEW